MRIQTAKTTSEALFEQYLNVLGVDYDYEPSFGSKKPDYGLKDDAGRMVALAEVKELDWPPSVPRLSDDWCHVRGVDSYTPIREKINTAARQFSAAKHLPCMLVLYDNDHYYSLNYHSVYGAMFGNI